MKIHLFNLKLDKVYHHPEMVCEYSFDYKDSICLNNPKAIYNLAIDILQMYLLAEEYVYAFCLDISMYHINGIFQVSHGTVNCSVLSPREVLICALLCGASKLILVHNHPSGNPKPSKEDILMTEKMKDACGLIEIPLIDHIIIGERYCSLQKNIGIQYLANREYN